MIRFTNDKSTLINNFDNLITVSDITQEELRRFDENETIEQKVLKNKYHVVHSSGSTGKPRYFIYDEKAWNEMLIGIIRAALWNMTMPQILKLLMGRPRILYIAATDGRYGGAMAVGDGIDGVGAKQLFLDIKVPLEEWIKNIKEFKPNMIIGYPSAIKILAELVQNGEIELDIFRVISCGEPLDVNLRKYLETVFKANVVNFYGASESLALGVEIDYNEGMCLFDDMNYIEIEDGNMYITSLYNYSQPLIRYKLTDRLILKESQTNYTFTMVESLVGRNEDILWFENDNNKKEFLHPLAIEGFCIEGLIDYQFRKIDNKAFEMIAQSSNEEKQKLIKEEMKKQMKQILKEKKLEYVKFGIKHAKGYELTNSNFDENTRAPIWYSHDGVIDSCKLNGLKLLRECTNTKVLNSEIDSREFGWKCSNIEMKNTNIISEYIFLDSKNVKLDNVKFQGKYSFQYMENLEISNSVLDTKDAFWHSKNVTVRDSIVKGEYLAWFSYGLTLINCKIIGTQPLCYCTNLKLINCEMEDTDLAFEYSDVDADIKGNVISIKNPKSGTITVDSVGEIITEDPVMECNGKVVIRNKEEEIA